MSQAWEAAHGRIPPRSWVLMRTDWSKRIGDPTTITTCDETAPHSPGPDADAVRFLVEERDVIGFGTETIGTDAGQAAHLQPALSGALLSCTARAATACNA